MTQSSSERFAAIRAEMLVKKAMLGDKAYQAECDRDSAEFAATYGNQAYADNSPRQMEAIAVLGQRVKELEAEKEAVNNDDLFILRQLVYGSK